MVLLVIVIAFIIIVLLLSNKNSAAKQAQIEAEQILSDARLQESELNVKIANARTQASKDWNKSQQEIADAKQKTDELIKQARDLEYQKTIIQEEILPYENRLQAAEVGLLSLKYDFGESVVYKFKLDQLREQQAALVKNNQACKCSTDWVVEGSRVKGRAMTKETVKLMLRAFNGECDALIAKIKYDKIVDFETRMRKSFTTINKFGESSHIFITQEYLSAKIEELHLTHGFLEKQFQEKEEQKMIRDRMREEQKAQQELDKAEREALDEEKRFALALEKAKRDVSTAVGLQQKSLLEQIKLLEEQLKEAKEKSAKAISMAQLTRRGHVYVLSNIGSFGENVFKIGMTRRLDPQERVDELGGASVPFRFDVHAMIFSEDAPALETKLHHLFASKRINKVNIRREFFQVSLDEIEKVVRENHGEFSLTKLAEAAEYRKSI